jgi:hypothetical protein
MAKKSRRARTAVSSQFASGTAASPVVQPVRPVRVARTPSTQVAKEVDFRKEYHYVIKDLKLTFMIAAVLLVVMIVLALFVA